MTSLTFTLVNAGKTKKRSGARLEQLDAVADRLVAEYGVPSLGNLRDPVAEILYIVLSARTTDGQYRRTYRMLRSKYRTLAALAGARIGEIRKCIASGGLANKRAAQVRAIAKTIYGQLGINAGRRLRALGPQEAFDYLTALPGMGPKSALCVMMYSLNHDVFPVDINVQRIAERMGLLPRGLKHYRAQQRLPNFVPHGRAKELHIGMVVHGRRVCLPGKPLCERCVLVDLCRHGTKRTANQRDC